MRLKHSFFIENEDFTHALISVSSIDVGVRKLGFGYVSDVSVECAYFPELLDAVGKNATVGLFLEGRSYLFKGKIKSVSVSDGKTTLSIQPQTPENLFKPRKRIFVSAYGKHFTVPVVYGNGVCNAELLAIQKKAEGTYQLLVGDNPDVQGAYQVEEGVYAIDDKILLRYDTPRWEKLPDSSQAWDLTSYGSDVYLRICRNCHDKYGVKKLQDGSLRETFLTSERELFLKGDDYDYVKFVWNAPPQSLCIDSFDLSVYENRDLSMDNEIRTKKVIRVNSISRPHAILSDIFLRNSIPFEKRSQYWHEVNLTFQADEGFKEVAQKVALFGLIYVIPKHDRFLIVSTDPRNPSVFTFTENLIIPQTLSIEKTSPEFNKLTVIYNRGSSKLTAGSGTPEKEITADFIADYASASNFANAYLQHSRKNTTVKLSTPLLPETLDLEVGDFVNLDCKTYRIRGKFQVIQKTIRKTRIDFKLKET